MEKSGIGRTRNIVIIAIAIICVVAAVGAGMLISKLADNEKITFVDDYDRTIVLEGLPSRIVSIAPTPTEILFAVGAGDLVVGVDDFSNYPAETANLPKVGNYELNIEAIVGLYPDLVVSSDLVPTAQLEAIENRDIPYMVLATRTMEDVFKDILLVGNITGHLIDAEVLVASLSARVDAVTNLTLAEDVVKPTVYFEYYPLWTYGPGSFGHDLIELAGGINIAETSGSEYVQLNDEFVIATNPEIIIYTYGVMASTTEDDIISRPAWDGITAVEEDRVFAIDDDLTSRYGPRVVDGLEQLAAILHPELFE